MTGKTGRIELAFGGENRGRGLPELSSALLAVLLVFEVASLIAGTEAVFFACIVLAWLVLAAVVGSKNLLDAGCLYMLVSLGMVIVVHVALQGPFALLP